MRRHATHSGYVGGCRCADCSRAHAEYCKVSRVRRGERTDAAPHGTASGYWNWNCRCDPCRTAGSVINRAKYLRLKERMA